MKAENLTRRRSWAEHSLSIPTNISWALLAFYLLTLIPIHDRPTFTLVLGVTWLVANVAFSILVHRTREVTVATGARHDDGETVEGTSLVRDAMRRLRRNQLAVLSMGILVVLSVLCFSQRITYTIHESGDRTGGRHDAESFYSLHVDHTRVNTDETSAPPNARHWFGTDALGRDIFARTLYGGSISFIVGVVATLVSLVIGVTWGAVAGYAGGRIDHYMMRIVDVLYGLPFIFLVILILSLVNGLNATASQHRQDVVQIQELEERGLTVEAVKLAGEKQITRSIRTAVFLSDSVDSVVVMFFALGLVQWLTMARITRGQVLSLRRREFVVAARVVGASSTRIIFRHIIPNLLGPVIVYTTLTVPTVVLAEAFLSFIGLGISEPHCSWGTLASEGIYAINVIKPYWWLITYPAVAISLALFSLNFVGDGLRDALDPRGQR